MQTSISLVEKRMIFLDRKWHLAKKADRPRINKMIDETRNRFYPKMKVTRLSMNTTAEIITQNGKYSLD